MYVYCLSACYRVTPGSMETSGHRAGIISWLPWRCARWHQRWPDWDPSAPLGGEAQRAHWHQEAPPAVWEPQEGDVGELHSTQVVQLHCVCLCVGDSFFFHLMYTLSSSGTVQVCDRFSWQTLQVSFVQDSSSSTQCWIGWGLWGGEHWKEQATCVWIRALRIWFRSLLNTSFWDYIMNSVKSDIRNDKTCTCIM